ncbi:aldehyde dehydrogenase family protein [Paraburkholderia caribensis]|uniref:aldehyde dehydrogenase family protein n=1 Tax=Paraburkholderia caribensis TaxID=75105 RepID=UPI001CAB62E5|nr:aldehyde dehydrogenase family protein [Paraburkholderia caribensis]CAG9243745.1 Putative aldehyde dehydrogenase family protein [Paraburkholderia caribensis]
MDHSFKLLIDGTLREGSTTSPVINPATEQTITLYPVASKAQLDEAVAAAKRSQPQWARLPSDERSQALVKIAETIEKNIERLAHILTLEQGKPLADAHREVNGLAGAFRYFATLDIPVEVREDSPTRRVEIHHRPLGVVAAITPWNFPLALIGNKLPPALLAGNAVVLKPAPTTPLSTLLLGELIADILPAGVVNVIADRNDLGDAMTSHPDVQKITFTGSISTGRKVMASAAQGLKRLTLELGGNDPAIVMDNVDPKFVAEKIFAAGFINSGQVCCAVKRVYVHEKVYDAFVAELRSLAATAKVGDGAATDVRFGPVQNKAQFSKLQTYLNAARTDGEVVAGGEVMAGPGYFITPAVVTGLSNGHVLVDEEQFGPLLPIVRYADIEEAISAANALQFGLGASVWSADEAKAYEIATRLDAGTVWVNQHLDLAPSIPLPAAKQSGVGVAKGIEGLLAFTQMTVLNFRKADGVNSAGARR